MFLPGLAGILLNQIPRGIPHGFLFGAVAQLGERLICIQEVVGSIPISSTKIVVRSSGIYKRLIQWLLGRVAQVARARP